MALDGLHGCGAIEKAVFHFTNAFARVVTEMWEVAHGDHFACRRCLRL